VNLSRKDQSSHRLGYHQIGPTNPFEEFKKADVEQSIAGRFEHQVCKYPQRLAVKTKSQRLTYDELNRISNRAAHAVLACCDDNEPIAVLFNQGAGLITASLGVLKAGKAYVSIDLSLPRAKTTHILEHVQSRLILTDKDHLSLAHELAADRLKILNLDEMDGALADENPGLSISPDQIAYINYTSGSTGEPKGVVWNHRNELFGIRVKTNELHVSPEDRISLVRSNNVGATRDMFLALLNGAALFPFDLHEEGLAHLGDWLLEEEITVYTCVATIFRHSVQGRNRNRRFPNIRLIHIGGEPLSKTDVELYKKHFSDECIFVNRYSISETQAVSYYFIDKQTEIKDERVPVGYPLEGNEILLLDEDGNEIEGNQIGEIAVKSPYLALGYWRQPELTRAKFFPDPNGGSARIYLSGDLGYRLPDGCLIHTGRKDFQAKIRGHRVEVSAIEMALLDIPAIKQVAVVPRDDLGKDKRLVAYVVPQPGQALTTGEMRALLKDKLPSYMLPSAFVMLDSLPLTASGKVDRRALPPPPKSREKADTSYAAANTLVEKVLVKLWADTMGIEDVGIHDDFSELGVDSLLSAQIVSRVNDTFPLKRPLNTLLEAPTVAKLSKFIIEQETLPGQSEQVAHILLKIEDMSAEEISRALEEERGTR
jgi:amino acid adenylation domain-containing protein